MGKKRKTKEQKIRAKLRRLEKKLQEKVEEKAEKKALKTKVKRQKKKVGSKRIEAKIEETAYSNAPKYLWLDLRKTLFLTLLAISLEFVVYWWVRIK